MKRGLLALLLLMLPAFAKAQVQVMPIPEVQFLDATGMPLVGGQLFTYVAGTNTLQATYTDSTMTTLNPDPVILDPAGRASVWVTGQAYKFVLEDNFGNVQWVQDNVSVGIFPTANNTFSGNNIFNGSSTFNGTIITTTGGTLNGNFAGNPNFSGTPTFSSALTFLGTTTFSGTPIFLSGANLGTGTFSGNAVFSGNVTFSGVPLFSNAPVFSGGIDSDTYKGVNPGGLLSIAGVTGSVGVGESISLAAGNGDTNFSGGNVTIGSGAGVGTGAGGNVSITGGSGGATGNGGAVILSAGNAGGGTTNGGNFTINSGTGSGAGTNGNIILQPCAGPCNGSGSGGDVVINRGVANNGTGFQHVRQTGCSFSFGASCPNTITWPTAFPDTNYTFSCSLINTVEIGHLAANGAGTKTATTVLLQSFSDTNSGTPSTGEVDCIAVHD